jgi:hypothetical protein
MEQGDSVLGALAELERRYDGPIPEPWRSIARLGSPERVLFAEADGQTRFFTMMIRNQIEALRKSGGVVAAPPHLLSDLALYRRERHFWRREAARWRAAPERVHAWPKARGNPPPPK